MADPGYSRAQGNGESRNGESRAQARGRREVNKDQTNDNYETITARRRVKGVTQK